MFLSSRERRYLSLSDKDFRRVIGVKKETYDLMLAKLKDHRKGKGKKRGTPYSLNNGEKLFLALEYWREYTTYLSLGINYNVSESTAFRVVRYVEDILIKSGLFNLPGKKVLLEEGKFEVIVVDATETFVERPQTPTKLGKKNQTQA